MPDTDEDSLAALRRLQDRFREFLSAHGYALLETPILEPTELFLRKSGGELAARMYTFTDPGGNQVSLRPEYTSSVVRHHLEGDSPSLPIRVQYSGPVFRYGDRSELPRQFTQVGAELLGSVDVRADAEILSISHGALTHLGIAGHRMVMTDQGVLYRLLEALELSDRAVGFILASIPDLKDGTAGMTRVQQRAEALHILRAPMRDGRSPDGLPAEGARDLLESLMRREELGSPAQRDPAEIVDRLLRRFTGADDPARLHRGLELASRLGPIRGEPASSIARAEAVIRDAGLDTSALDGIKQVIPIAEARGLPADAVNLDFGLTRGLAYYTGTVFEITLDGQDGSLGGGGRYDGLARALGGGSQLPALGGGSQLPALGFAYTAERLLEVTGSDEVDVARSAADVLVLAATVQGYRHAAHLANELRRKGKRVELDVRGMDLKQGLDYARGRGIVEVVEVDASGDPTSHRVADAYGRHRAEGVA